MEKVLFQVHDNRAMIKIFIKDGQLFIESDYPISEAANLFLDYCENQLGKKIDRKYAQKD